MPSQAFFAAPPSSSGNSAPRPWPTQARLAHHSPYLSTPQRIIITQLLSRTCKLTHFYLSRGSFTFLFSDFLVEYSRGLKRDAVFLIGRDEFSELYSTFVRFYCVVCGLRCFLCGYFYVFELFFVGRHLFYRLLLFDILRMDGGFRGEYLSLLVEPFPSLTHTR